MANRTSQHIMRTSANLLGFCLILITSLSIANHTETHIIDEFTSIIALMLTFSCVLSFIRTTDLSRAKKLETIRR